MKILMKNSTMEFKPTLPPGTEVPVTLGFTGDYAKGNGYYLNQNGRIVYVTTYVTRPVGVSDVVLVSGYSKIKLSNLLLGASDYQGRLAFFDDVESINGTNVLTGNDARITPVDETTGTALIDIPEGAVYVRFGSNNANGGSAPIGDLVAALVV